MKRPRSEVVVSDLHGLFLDKRAFAAALRVMDLVEPERIIVNGDAVDMPSVSKYDIDPARLQTWSVQREAKAMEPIWKALDERSPEPVVYLYGNHEDRWQKYFSFNAPRVHELYKEDLRRVMRVPERWTTMRYRSVLKTGRLQITHGHKPSSNVAGTWAANLRRRTGGHLLIGHSHRQGYSPFTDGTGTFGAWEAGHLSDPKPHYAEDAQNWQQGFAVVTHHGSEFNLELVPVLRGRAFFRGQVV